MAAGNSSPKAINNSPVQKRRTGCTGIRMIFNFFKKYWFMSGLLIVFVVTLGDSTGDIATMGRWLKAHYGPRLVIMGIFFFSGLILDTKQIRSGLTDRRGTLTALILIVVIAPVMAALLGMMPLAAGIKIGIFLVAVMPTTLSSGVVMTAAAGGNMAHAWS